MNLYKTPVSSHHSSGPARQAFTLIELLTVIAIIGILAAILIPVVGAVRESARAAQCTSNLRQIGGAMALYANDNSGRYPPPANWPEHGSSDLRTTFHYRIWSYIGYDEETFSHPENSQLVSSEIENIFHCPTTRIEPRLVPGGSQSGDNYAYGMNTIPNTLETGDITRGLLADRLTAPSRTMAVMEVKTWHANPGRYKQFGLIPHKDAGNFLFYDGHVEALRFTAVPKNSYEPEGEIFWGGQIR